MQLTAVDDVTGLHFAQNPRVRAAPEVKGGVAESDSLRRHQVEAVKLEGEEQTRGSALRHEAALVQRVAERLELDDDLRCLHVRCVRNYTSRFCKIIK